MPAATKSAASERDNSNSGNAFVRKMAGLTQLWENDLAALAKISAHPRHARARSDLVGQDEGLRGALTLLQGFACRYPCLIDGRRQIIAFLLPGDLCDFDYDVLGPMDHAIGTLTACSVSRVSSKAFASLIVEHPRIERACWRAKLAEVATLPDWVVSLGRRRAPERLAHLFCELLSRLQAVDLASTGTCDLPITQSALGDAVGLSAVHVNRSLQTLRSAGLIRLTSNKLQVIDLPGLQSYCEFSSTHRMSTALPAVLGCEPVALGAA